jgi:hypothetical protein
VAKGTPRKPAKVAKKAAFKVTATPRLLSGGNPQIAKAEGDAAVQAYIAAMPDWKRDVGRRLDALIVRTVPGVRKAVKWNSPFYGVEGRGWFLSFHCFTNYVKVTFFRGTSLHPLPPGESKHKEVRYLDIREDEPLDSNMTRWIRQAAALPGWSTKESKGESPAEPIDPRVQKPGDWRGEALARIRGLIKQAEPEVVEEVKWRKPSNPAGIPVWSHPRAGIICTGETYKSAVKLTFAKGAALEDPSGLFNSSLDGNTRRAIDLHEGDTIDARAFKALVRAAVALNTSARGEEATARPPTAARSRKRRST